MDWITLLRSLQSDFIKRLTSGCLLHCETESQYSELTIISGERLKSLREFCWQMAEKYKRTSSVRDVFINNLKGKLGEEVVKERLANLITEVDYEKRFGGDGKVDFTLTSDPTIGIEVKSRHGSFDKIRWTISSEEVEKNVVVVCILIQEEVNEAQPEYHLFLAGFLPTNMIKLRTGKISFGIEQLLYGGGLCCYLEQIQSSKQKTQIYHDHQQESFSKQTKEQLLKSPIYSDTQSYLHHHNRNEDLHWLYLKLGNECLEKREYEAAIINYTQALEINPDASDIYYKRGLAHYYLEDYEVAIEDYTQAIHLTADNAKAYNRRGLARYQLGEYEAAIEDYTQAIRINPNIAIAYKNRADAFYQIGNNQGAIEDYTHAIRINPDYALTYKNRSLARHLLGSEQKAKQIIRIDIHDAVAYKNRGNSRSDLGDYEGAIADYTQAIEINPSYADAYYNRGNAHSDLGNYEEAIADYTRVIEINPNYADAYYNRANARFGVGDKPAAIEDFQQAANFYWKEGKLEEHKDTRERILELQIEESIDILNF
ncbi:MAG: tetratricopeptide repeat protein [Desmonostoc vinosum HA7617-LM4]|jgi:tetratricopeptide (TPR) repeat protein|nr:tetratricopeptide repeat protein [Desmonostoc vinosum HA7617-LM4]